MTLGIVESVIQICQPGVLKFLVKNGKIGVEKIIMPNLPSKNLEKSSVAFQLLLVVILLKRVIGIHSPPSLSRPVAWDKPLVSFWKSCQFLSEIQPIRHAK